MPFTFIQAERRFERQVRAHQDRVYGFAVYFLGDRAEAEDVTQEVLLRLWHHRAEVDERRLLGWLLRVTRNACVDVLRKRKARRARLVPLLDDRGEPAGHGPTPDADAQAADFQRHLRRALEQLAEPYRSIVILREIQELKYEEISGAMDLPLNTVKVYLHRGRKMLRQHLSKVIHRETVYVPRQDWLDDRVEAYLDGNLPAVQRAAFERALVASSDEADWEDEVLMARQIRVGLQALPRPACPPHVTQAVLARVRREEPQSWAERLRTRLVRQGATIWQPALAMAVLLLLVISAALIKPAQPAVSPEVAEARAQVEWTLAYLSHVGRQAGQAVRHEVIEERVVSPVQGVLGDRSERPDSNKP